MSKKITNLVQNLLDSVNTPGGHIIICVGLLFKYASMDGVGLSHDIAIFAIGVLARSMGGARTPPSGGAGSTNVSNSPGAKVDTSGLAPEEARALLLICCFVLGFSPFYT